MIGVIDVGGFDFAHPDFLDQQGQTRFTAIWDMGAEPGAPGAEGGPPAGFQYGTELKHVELQAEINKSNSSGNLQSQREIGSHGTHVASIAAGNSGMCPGAEVAAVLLDFPKPNDEDHKRAQVFCDSSRIADAVEYLCGLADSRKKPISINISLGTNGGPHDGSGPVSRWLEELLVSPGRCISVSAGNASCSGPLSVNVKFAGSPEGQPPKQLVVIGPVHGGGQIAGAGLEKELQWVVQGNGVADLAEHNLEIWYSALDRMAVAVLPPGEAEWIVVRPQEFVENRRLSDGTTASVYSELFDPTNGDNHIVLHISPNYEPEAATGVRSGAWRIRLRGEVIRDGRYHAWVERDDLAQIGGTRAEMPCMLLPSFLSQSSSVDSHAINGLACSPSVIGVGNLDRTVGAIASSSSKGPTRDHRSKPDIVAPGTGVVAAKGFDPNASWLALSGTSMASPYVAGVAGLMLAANPDLTSSQIGAIMRATARPLPGTVYDWQADAGFGEISAADCIALAEASKHRIELR
jgi:subtilisin family serine protease